MELKDVLARSMMRLTRVSFVNDLPMDTAEATVELAPEDSLDGFQRTKDEIFATYERKLYSTDSKIKIEIAYQFRSKIKDEVSITDKELIDIIQKHKDQFILFAPSETSLIIANIMKTAGFPAIITQPTFVEKNKE